MHDEQTEVLVVGAGPVGLLTAILAAEAGLRVMIVDQEARTTERSYACALHPRTLKLLDGLGLAEKIITQGRRVDTFAFYDGKARRAQVKLSEVGGQFPYVLIMSQGALEHVLEERLQRAGVSVNWRHRFDSCEEQSAGITAMVEALGGTATGYIVPHWETVVTRRVPVRAQFVVGADGHGSLVRQRLGVEYKRLAGPQFFAAYEFESATPAEAEVRVVLDDATTNVLWPLSGNKCRWTFQLLKSEGTGEFPGKERRPVRYAHPAVDEQIRLYVERVARERAPWFSATVKAITWCTDVVFEHRLAQAFGRGRAWLAGDAAHQTGPVGVQSMNVGMSEAAALVGIIQRVLRQHAALGELDGYTRGCQEEWARLLGLNGGLKARATTDAWAKERRDRILPCLPAGAADLAPLAAQLQLDS